MKSKKEQYNKYIKNIKKINNLKNKFLLVQMYTGFGNKIFNLIICIYLKKNFNYNIYYVDTISTHTKIDDPNLKLVFPNLSKEIIFISDNEGDYLRFILNIKKLPHSTIKNINNINNNLNSDRILLITPFFYKLVFEMWDSFTPYEKNLFYINEKIIDKNIMDYTKTKYATIHIRYGDKLNLGLVKENNKLRIEFPIFTPEYYYEQIKIILKLNLPIIILTDSSEVVKEFIIKKYNLDLTNIFLLDINFINSFYLMMYSSYMVISHSTFSYAAYILSKDFYKSKTVIFVTLPYMEEKYKTEDCLISKDWKIILNKKYILNFDQKLLKYMILFNEKFFYNYYKIKK